MALIKVTISELESIQGQVSKLSNKVGGCGNAVARVKSNLDMKVKQKSNIDELLNKSTKQLKQQSEMLQSYANVLNNVVDEFLKLDKNGIDELPVVSAFERITKIPQLIYGGEPSYLHEQLIEKIGTVGDLLKSKISKTYGKAVKVAKDVGAFWKDKVDYLVDSYENKGWVYSAVQYGKSAVKIAGGFGAVALAIGSGGTLAPLALAYGVDSIVSGMFDVVDITNNLRDGKTAEIEENSLLKDGMKVIGNEVGGTIGSWLGDENLGQEIGEKVGAGAYDVGKIVTTVYSISTGIDKITQAKDFNISGIGSEIDDVAKGGWDILTKQEFSSIWNLKSDLAYQAKLLSYEVPNTVNAIQNVSLITKLSSDIIGEPKDIIVDLIKGDTPEADGVVKKSSDFILEYLFDIETK